MKKMLYGIIITLIVIMCLGVSFHFYERNKAKNDIAILIKKQGIKENDIIINKFSYSLKNGSYEKYIYIKHENSDYYYRYSYQPRAKVILFNAVYYSKKSYEKTKLWGGSYLTEEEAVKKLEYPDLNKKYLKNVNYSK